MSHSKLQRYSNFSWGKVPPYYCLSFLTFLLQVSPKKIDYKPGSCEEGTYSATPILPQPPLFNLSSFGDFCACRFMQICIFSL